MKIQLIFTALMLTIALLLVNVSTAFAMPPMPSSFYGTVKLDGANVPEGTIISARINGVVYASMTAILYLGDTVYYFDVPGDDPDTTGVVEGGVAGNTVVFYVGSYVANQTAPWQSGSSVELNLTASTPHTVTFDNNGGSGTMTAQTANVPTTLTTNAFTRVGYSFSGWNTAANGSGTNYADGATYDFSANITLYAKWTALPNHTVTFDSNGGTGTMTAQTANVPTSLTLNTFTRTGYSFSGWNTAANGTGTSYANGAIYPFAADATLYAQWTALPNHTVTFNSNGGTGSMTPQTANVPTALTTNAFTRTGYSFSEWNTLANGTGTSYANGASYPFTADVTLYAQWTALPNHTVTFNANLGTGTMTPQTANVPTALTANAFTRAGYSFSGWNTAAGGGGTAYANGAIYPFAADATLYAQWTALPNQKKIIMSTASTDGWILESSETSGIGGTKDNTATTFRLGDEVADKQYRTILHFNTSGLPDNAVITKVTLKIRKQGLVGTDPFTILGGLKVDMNKPFFGTTVGLVIDDFQAAAGKGLVATFGATPVSNWYSALLNATGRAYVNKTGTTQFRLRFAIGDNDNNVADYMKFFSGNYATASARPTLIIEYYVP